MTNSVQHYVPQAVLKNFCFKKKHLWVFDKKKLLTYKSNIRNVACEKHFYDIKINGVEASLEPGLSKLETDASKVIQEIVKQESLAGIDEEERELLSFFFGAQFARTKEFRMRYSDLQQKVVNHIRLAGLEPDKIKGPHSLNEIEIQNQSVRSLSDAAYQFTPYFMNKVWLLYRTKPSNPFFTSDNPIALQNALGGGPFGNLGFGVRGIEIYFPLSSTLQLSMICSSHEKIHRYGYQKFLRLKQFAPNLLESMSLDLRELEIVEKALTTRKAVEILPERVMNLNSLQVVFSTRFVFSSLDNFSLVRKMVDSNPAYKGRS